MDMYMYLRTSVFRRLTFIFIVDIFITFTISAESCGTPPVCCRYFQFDKKSNSCSDCIPGYFGNDCNITCRYPNYGQNCQLECICGKKFCNHISGCEQLHVTEDNDVEDQSIFSRNPTNIATVNEDVTDGTVTGNQSYFTQNSIKYETYSNKSVEKDVLWNCSSIRPYITRPFRSRTMLISLCLLTSAFFVITAIYFRLKE
eukprot:XP_011427316.1 PREDICTED: uncharacterized protein LOC105328239 [Crassostrea gigas]